jgi:hypothetical protein
LVELDNSGEDNGPLIPLEMLQFSNEILSSSKFYRPQILYADGDYGTTATTAVTTRREQSYETKPLPSIPQEAQAQQQQAGQHGRNQEGR